ncbi:hypothetical protein SAMN05421823_10263 [Catalinimonas alkaloidigena]|uniref:DUF6438 domain-containing protein n=2 Tax=Catalinimonas alkaloidigena TaxID=1075417 RepID=A0A1G8ZQY6_9BACT|nr:hypothetical protein SAMN05421823_10263 [Catalinimonas alkaloidigena]
MLMLALVFAAGACRSQKDTEARLPVLTIEKTPCFGRCPTYKASVYEDGTVFYEGRQFVAKEGTYEFQAPAEQVKQWLQEAKQLGYFQLEDEYPTKATDLPSTITSVRLDGKTKQITAVENVPPALRAFQTKLHESMMQLIEEQEGKPATERHD